MLIVRSQDVSDHAMDYVCLPVGKNWRGHGGKLTIFQLQQRLKIQKLSQDSVAVQLERRQG